MITMNWNDLNINNITNLFLYGKLDIPANLEDETLIRQPEVVKNSDALTQITLTDVSSFMTNGPGRYANGVQSPLVNAFMKGDIMPSTGVKQEILAENMKTQLNLAYDRFLNFSQTEYGANSTDFDIRAYIYGHTTFGIAKNAKFVVEADGTRHIENFAILPANDNFDFNTTGPLQALGEIFLEDKIDPSGIGRKVYMIYDENSKETYRLDNIKDYTNPLYQQDLQKFTVDYFGADGLAQFGLDSFVLTHDLFDSGITKFLDIDHKPILYGSDGAESIIGTVSRTGVDIAPGITSYGISGYVQNGIHYIGGKGLDYIKGTEQDDKLFGGEGIDILEALNGDDTLDGGKDSDALKGGDGYDTYKAGNGDDITDTDGKGQVYFNDNLLHGGTKKEGETVWKDADGHTTYDKMGGDLIIKDGNSILRITHFQNDNLGIHLNEDKDDTGVPVVKKEVKTAEVTKSPIVLDLNGDGITTTSLTTGIFFDHDSNNFAEQTGWINNQDGLLVRDLNNNGQIDNGHELFGSETLLLNGQKAANGYLALAELDSNADKRNSLLIG